MAGSTPGSGSGRADALVAPSRPTADRAGGAAEPGADHAALTRRRRLRSVLRTPGGVFAAMLLGLTLGVAVFADVLAPAEPFARDFDSLLPPSGEHWMGTDQFGRDLSSRVLHGTRRSLLISVAAGAIVMPLGVGVGLTSGYRGGWIDDVLMRATEVVQTLPVLFVAILVVAVYGPGTPQVVLTLGLMMWSWLARVVRSEVLSLREREFVDAAVASGASHWRISVREILPNALPSAIVMMGLILAQVILLEAFLGFLGLTEVDRVSLGRLAGEGQDLLRVAWWLPFFPGIAILVVVLGMNLMSDVVNDALGGGSHGGPGARRQRRLARALHGRRSFALGRAGAPRRRQPRP